MNSFFKGKRVLITGHTGFKGSWLASWLCSYGADVIGFSLDPISSPSHIDLLGLSSNITDIRGDIRDINAIKNVVTEHNPDIVFHLAAQALVRKSYKDPIETWATNAMGTLNLMESLKLLKNKCAAIIITSDKCYDNVEQVWGYRENDSLGGPDPYSASKGAAELIFRSHFKSFFSEGNVLLASARAGNVIGGGDWSEDRIVPDCIRAWCANEAVVLRNAIATRPWQHVLEPLGGYLLLAKKLYAGAIRSGESFNFGPQSENDHSVGRLVKQMTYYVPNAIVEDLSHQYSGPYESTLLKLNCDKALNQLGWHAVLDFNQTVEYTMEWYLNWMSRDVSILDFTMKQISLYDDLLHETLGKYDYS